MQSRRRRGWRAPLVLGLAVALTVGPGCVRRLPPDQRALCRELREDRVVTIMFGVLTLGVLALLYAAAGESDDLPDFPEEDDDTWRERRRACRPQRRWRRRQESPADAPATSVSGGAGEPSEPAALGPPPTSDELVAVARAIEPAIFECFESRPRQVVVQTRIVGETGGFYGLQLRGADARFADLECVYLVLHEAPPFRRFEGHLDVQWQVGDVEGLE